MTGAQSLARLVAAGDGLAISGVFVGDVTAAGIDDRDVVVSDDGGRTQQTMRCTSGYPVRTVGDTVLAVKVGSWQVLGKVGAHPADVLSASQVQAMINASLGQLAVPPTVAVTWGQGAPGGSGWRAGTTVYARDDGSGNRSIYLDVATGSGGSTKPPPPATVPKPVIVPAVWQGGWRGSQQDRAPHQGNSGRWTGNYTDWVGAWGYDSRLASALATGTVVKVEIRLSRTTGGVYAGVSPQLATHTRTGIAKPDLANGFVPGLSLPVGGAGWAELSGTARGALGSGAAKGIACYGSGTGQYMVFDPSGSGDLKVTYG